MPFFGRTGRYLALLPALLFLVLLSAWPLGNLVALSFAEVSWEGGKSTWTWVGLQNYQRLAADTLFHSGILNTIILVVVATTCQVVIGLALALFCSRLGRQSAIYRTIFILPILIPGIIIGAIWRLMYNAQFGVINQLVAMVGFQPVDWLGSPSMALWSVIIVDIWHWTPFAFLMLLAAIESLPQDLYEAAEIDGANGWQKFRRITLPLLWPAIFVTLVFRGVTAFKVFDEVYLLTGGGPGTATEVISFTIYQRFFVQDSPGYGSALSISVIFLVAVLVAVALTRQRSLTQ